MSVMRKLITQIENLNVEQLCEALEYNGYGDCVDRIRNKSIDGQAFLKLTEVQVSLWRLPPTQMRRLWSFIEHVRQNPSNFVLAPKKTIQVATPPISNFNTFQNNFQTNSLGRPQAKQKPKIAEKIKIENFGSKSENRQFSSLTKEDSKSVKGKLEELFKLDANRNTSFLHNKPVRPKSPINNYVEENYDDDSNDGYLPPISMEPKNLRSPQVENKSVFLNQMRESYENHNIEPEKGLTAKPNYKNLTKRPLPPIPHEMGGNFDPPKFINMQDRQNLVSQKPATKTASIFKRPILAMMNDRQKIEEPEEIEEYTPILSEEPTPFTRPLPAIPIEDDEDLAEYGTISEEEEELDTKLHFKPIDQHPINFLSQLKLVTNQKHKANIVEEEQDLLYEPVPDVIEQKEKFLKPSINLKTRPLPPPPNSSSRSNQKMNEERLLPPVQVLSKRSIKPRVNERKESASDSDEESVLIELLKMSNKNNINTLTKSPKPIDKSRSPTNLPKPPSMLPKPPQFGGLNLGSGEIFENKEAKPVVQRDDFKMETYYRGTDRKGARRILNNLEEGTFLVRPSRDGEYICTLSIIHSKKMFNVGVQQDQMTGFITLGSMMDVDQPDFRRLQDIINYYCVHPLCLSGQLIVLKNILPFERR